MSNSSLASPATHSHSKPTRSSPDALLVGPPRTGPACTLTQKALLTAPQPMPERASAKSMSIAATGEALDGNDGIYENVEALVEAIIGSPPHYDSPSTSADYLSARTVELCNLMQIAEMLTHSECVERLGESKRSELDRSRSEPPDVVFWRETPRLILMQHKREGKFVHVLGNVSTVRVFQGPVMWLLGLREIGALSWMVMPTQ